MQEHCTQHDVGLRLDGQHYNFGGDHTQISPRLNLRYDFNDRLRLYTSIGRFTQAQHVEEWRVEEAQGSADPAQVSIHSVVGLTYDPSTQTHWGIEAYRKQWTTVAAYFDNRLDPLALTPDLAPDRIRLDPQESEASGLELNLRHDLVKLYGPRPLAGLTRVDIVRLVDGMADRGLRQGANRTFAYVRQ